MLYEGIPQELTFDVILHGDNPIQASDFGELLTALSKDYNEITNGVLIVVGLERGSFITKCADLLALTTPYIKELSDFIDLAKALSKFSSIIHGAIQHLYISPAPQKRKRSGYRSVEAILSTAVASGCRVEYRHVDSDGRRTDFSILPAEAAKIRERARLLRLERAQLKRIGEAQAQEPLRLNYDTETLVKSLASYPLIGRESNIDSVIRILVSSLKSGGHDSTIELIAQAFDSRGRGDIAALVRLEAGRESSQKQQEQ